jgi:hypothetical protein
VAPEAPCTRTHDELLAALCTIEPGVRSTLVRAAVQQAIRVAEQSYGRDCVSWTCIAV